MEMKPRFSWKILLPALGFALLLILGCSTTRRMPVFIAENPDSYELWGTRLMPGDWVLVKSKDGRVWRGRLVELDTRTLTLNSASVRARIETADQITLLWSDLEYLKRREARNNLAFIAGIPLGIALAVVPAFWLFYFSFGD